MNTKKLLELIKKNYPDKEIIRNKGLKLEKKDIEEIIDKVACLGNHKYIICEPDIIEINGFYYESGFEFFVPAFSIKVNDELLYSGYYECGITNYINGKIITKEEAIKTVEHILKEKRFKILDYKIEKDKDYER